MNRIRKAAQPARPASSEQDRIAALEATIEQLQREIDELRKDSRRIAELYDVVVERLGANRPAS
ncbi:hypothetical protein [Agromyces sp. NPDC058110]|uniref:hypothetical protein n=1 Tax=Agromyces sp. NPDC058110 TaxID=3346345 RepID=UPI0036DBA0E3